MRWVHPSLSACGADAGLPPSTEPVSPCRTPRRISAYNLIRATMLEAGLSSDKQPEQLGFVPK